MLFMEAFHVDPKAFRGDISLSIRYFTITAEIQARSLAIFYLKENQETA